MSWKPVDLAPRDGTLIVVAFRSPLTEQVSVHVTKWMNGAWVHESSAGEIETTGDVAFAWTSLPDSDS